jgi:hypothetical protein
MFDDLVDGVTSIIQQLTTPSQPDPQQQSQPEPQTQPQTQPEPQPAPADPATQSAPFNYLTDTATPKVDLEGVTVYSQTPREQLIAAGYTYWRNDGSFDWWRSPRGGVLWVQVRKSGDPTPETIAASEKIIAQVQGLLAQRAYNDQQVQKLLKERETITDPEILAEYHEEIMDLAFHSINIMTQIQSSLPEWRATVDDGHRAQLDELVAPLERELAEAEAEAQQ